MAGLRPAHWDIDIEIAARLRSESGSLSRLLVEPQPRSDMKIGVLGTGTVGSTLGTKLVELGYEVKMGSRTPNNEKAAEWVKKAGEGASQGTFADAASFGEILFNCTAGSVSIEALKMAGNASLQRQGAGRRHEHPGFLKGDAAYPHGLEHGFAGGQIQRAFPEAKVVKTLNTMTASIMVDPKLVPGDHDVFVSGNDPLAKGQVQRILGEFGWRNVIDLGDISTARGTEMWLALWVRLMLAFQNPMFNVHIQRSTAAPDPATASQLARGTLILEGHLKVTVGRQGNGGAFIDGHIIPLSSSIHERPLMAAMTKLGGNH